MMLNTYFSNKIYWPLAQKLKGESAPDALQKLDATQWQSAAELQRSQWQKVRRTVCRAAQQVPYYRDLYRQAGWAANNASFSYKDFQGLPTVHKEDLRDQFSHFLNPDYRGRITTSRTSGSTGISQILKYDSTHQSLSEAARWRAKAWWGISPGDPQAVIWGRPFTGSWDRMTQKLKSRLMNILLFSAFDLRDDTLARIWSKIERFGPKIIYGYPSAVFPLARFLREQRISARHVGLKVIMTTAEAITTGQRQTIEDVFGCKTANEYGCSETGGFAYECPSGSWHVASELTLVEFLDDQDRPVAAGSPGHIVVTHLCNDYMPLIRYHIGDIGAYKEGVCPCGRCLPMMDVAVAKESDLIRLEAGRTFSSELFDYINLAVMKAFPDSILQFRVTQKTCNGFDLEVVPGSKDIGAAEKLFVKHMHSALGEHNSVNIMRLPEIKREPTGKLRYFISELGHRQLHPEI